MSEVLGRSGPWREQDEHRRSCAEMDEAGVRPTRPTPTSSISVAGISAAGIGVASRVMIRARRCVGGDTRLVCRRVRSAAHHQSVDDRDAPLIGGGAGGLLAICAHVFPECMGLGLAPVFREHVLPECTHGRPAERATHPHAYPCHWAQAGRAGRRRGTGMRRVVADGAPRAGSPPVVELSYH